MITLNNYEEYFLLYADNELTLQERKDVDAFVLKHPYLKVELDGLVNSVLKPEDEIKFLNKEVLMKGTATGWINRDNYEEVFILYHDGELNEQQKLETEEFLRNNKGVEESFHQFAALKFVPESQIKFPDKSLLFRNEKPVVKLVVWRSLAAAVLLGFFLWGGYSVLNRYNEEKMVAGVELYQRSEEASGIASKANSQAGDEVTLGKVHIAKEEEENEATKERQGSGKLASERSRPAAGKEEFSVPEEKVAPVLATVEKEPAVEGMPIETMIHTEVPSVPDITSLHVIDENPSLLPQVNQQEVAASLNSLVAKEDLDTEHAARYISYAAADKNDNYIFYNVTFEEFKRSKVGAFLKQVTRVIERTEPVKKLLSSEVKLFSFSN